MSLGLVVDGSMVVVGASASLDGMVWLRAMVVVLTSSSASTGSMPGVGRSSIMASIHELAALGIDFGYRHGVEVPAWKGVRCVGIEFRKKVVKESLLFFKWSLEGSPSAMDPSNSSRRSYELASLPSGAVALHYPDAAMVTQHSVPLPTYQRYPLSGVIGRYFGRVMRCVCWFREQ